MIFFDPSSKKITLAVIIAVLACGFIFYFWADRNPFASIDRERGGQFWQDVSFVGTEKIEDIQNSIGFGLEGAKDVAEEISKEEQKQQLIDEAKKYAKDKNEESEESKFPIARNQEDCEEAGGTWGIYGEHGVELCNFATTDAGTECTDSSQCQAHCVVDLPEITLKDLPVEAIGTCSAQSLWLGCLSKVEDGYVYGVICQ